MEYDDDGESQNPNTEGEIKTHDVSSFAHESPLAFTHKAILNEKTCKIFCKKTGRIAGFKFKLGGSSAFIYKKTSYSFMTNGATLREM